MADQFLLVATGHPRGNGLDSRGGGRSGLRLDAFSLKRRAKQDVEAEQKQAGRSLEAA